MTLQLSIFGYLIMMAFYSIVTGLLFLLWLPMRHWQGWRFVIAPLALVFIALPWVDEIYIAWHFHELCKDAGVHVYKKVEVDGFLDDTSREERDGQKIGLLFNNPKYLEDWDRTGYVFKEYMLKDGGARHLERQPDGVYVTILDRPTARYVYKYSANNEDAGLQLSKTEFIIVDTQTDEIISRSTLYKRYPGWVEGLWIRFVGSGLTICERPLDDLEKKTLTGGLYNHTFMTIKQQ